MKANERIFFFAENTNKKKTRITASNPIRVVEFKMPNKEIMTNRGPALLQPWRKYKYQDKRTSRAERNPKAVASEAKPQRT
ncbi:MAG: hypothetical protein KJ772_07970, partial [Proteobacteria bacterium]|nr:hypothetical protein [Pseudomonadota bacterium]